MFQDMMNSIGFVENYDAEVAAAMSAELQRQRDNIELIASENMYTLDGGIEFASAPLTIRTADREFVDNESLDVLEMVEYLSKYKGKSGSACPGVGDWLDVFGDADEVYCVTIISTLSGTEK